MASKFSSHQQSVQKYLKTGIKCNALAMVKPVSVVVEHMCAKAAAFFEAGKSLEDCVPADIVKALAEVGLQVQVTQIPEVREHGSIVSRRAPSDNEAGAAIRTFVLRLGDCIAVEAKSDKNVLTTVQRSCFATLASVVENVVRAMLTRSLGDSKNFRVDDLLVAVREHPVHPFFHSQDLQSQPEWKAFLEEMSQKKAASKKAAGKSTEEEEEEGPADTASVANSAVGTPAARKTPVKTGKGRTPRATSKVGASPKQGVAAKRKLQAAQIAPAVVGDSDEPHEGAGDADDSAEVVEEEEETKVTSQKKEVAAATPQSKKARVAKKDTTEEFVPASLPSKSATTKPAAPRSVPATPQPAIKHQEAEQVEEEASAVAAEAIVEEDAGEEMDLL